MLIQFIVDLGKKNNEKSSMGCKYKKLQNKQAGLITRKKNREKLIGRRIKC